MRRALLVVALLLVAAPSAQADTNYGGVAALRNAPSGPLISVVRHDDGRVTARLGVAYRCRKHSFSNYVVRLKGSTADGVNFTASGRTRMPGIGRLRITMAGTIAPDSVAGKVTTSAPNCPKYVRDVVLRSESAPVGAPAIPLASTLFAGLTGQTTGGFRLAVGLRVTTKGRVWATWQAHMRCGPRGGASSIINDTPTTKINPDGSFSRSEVYTVRWTDGSRERFRVSFKGQFRADGVSGTLRARSTRHGGGSRWYPCDSGTQTWAART
ncbi:hypothetical protein [Solirubrobacter soli]|uniref:hypothetical protein n=1 Tax=Solirubrobacter soli TaxID=363832 RepID=UPI000408533D|nr:hypothetical protein [Solirubrobacter soli]